MVNWAFMETAPNDGAEFIVRFPLQGNVKGFCRWDKIHKCWLDKGEPFCPESQQCEWISIEALIADNEFLVCELRLARGVPERGD